MGLEIKVVGDHSVAGKESLGRVLRLELLLLSLDQQRRETLTGG